MDPSYFRIFIVESLNGAASLFIKDLEALSDEQFLNPIGGNVRPPVDFTYEVALVNRRFATRIEGQEPPAWSFDGFVTAPEEFRDREAAIAELKASVALVEEAFGGDPFRTVEAMGGIKPVYELVLFTARHITYHDGQLNYIQAFSGDNEVHW